jgi:hypothetical protein
LLRQLAVAGAKTTKNGEMPRLLAKNRHFSRFLIRNSDSFFSAFLTACGCARFGHKRNVGTSDFMLHGAETSL